MLDNYQLKKDRAYRLINMYERFNGRETLTKEELAIAFGVSPKTIQRDIEELRNYLADSEEGFCGSTIVYDKANKGYRLNKYRRVEVESKDILILLKILLSIEGLNSEEMNQMFNKLMSLVKEEDKACLLDKVNNERHYYKGPQHKKMLIDRIWSINLCIQHKKVVYISYITQRGESYMGKVYPLGTVFSEQYFYMIGYPEDFDGEYPIFFRIDRIQELDCLGENIPYYIEEYFEVGKLRQNTKYMYGGELQTIEFEFWGDCVEAVLDKLPTAEIVDVYEGTYRIKAQVYGKGINMWILSQRQYLKVIRPEPLRQEIKETIEAMLKNYT